MGEQIGLIVTAFSFGFVLFAHSLKRRPARRKQITGLKLWKAQFFFHPLIVGFLVFFAQSQSAWFAIMLVPFVFNFGVEPWDLPSDAIFYVFFYAHHVGPLLACLWPGGDSQDHTFAATNGLMFGHLWLLHTIGNLDHLQVISKQSLFWPYMLQGFVLNACWCHAAMQAAQGHGAALLQQFLPLLVQYAGRWGLYIYIRRLMGWPSPGAELYDGFETLKQPMEAGLLLCAAACVAVMQVLREA